MGGREREVDRSREYGFSLCQVMNFSLDDGQLF